MTLTLVVQIVVATIAIAVTTKLTIRKGR